MNENIKFWLTFRCVFGWRDEMIVYAWPDLGPA